MKKLTLLLVTLSIVFTSFAQSETGSFGVEINFNPFGGGENPVFSTDGLKARYFISEDMAVRGTLSFSTNLNEAAKYMVNGRFGTETATSTTFGFTPGFEYHVTKFDKGSVYVGAELGTTFGNQKTTFKVNESGVNDTNHRADIFALGAGVFTGADYFITRKIYIGAELGLNYASVKITPENTDRNLNDEYVKESGLGFRATPTFRLGWTF